MTKAATAVLLLGTNLGDRLKNILQAYRLIEEKAGLISKKSAVYDSDAWGIENQPGFYNSAIIIQTKQSPSELLNTLLSIEQEMGRIRYKKWGERLIDIDILYYNDLVVTESDLKIPHPELANRRFTLEPLCELIPDYVHPKTGKTQRQLLAECPDNLRAHPLNHRDAL